MSIIDAAQRHVAQHFVKQESKFNLQARAAYLALAPASVLVGTLEVAAGTLNAATTILTGGDYKSYKSTMAHFAKSELIFLGSYKSLLKTLNLKAITPQQGDLSFLANERAREVMSEKNFAGLDALRSFAIEQVRSDNVASREFTSRLSFAVLAVASLITAFVCNLIGGIAAVASFAFLGKVDAVNAVACVFLDKAAKHGSCGLAEGVMKMINPRAGEPQTLIDKVTHIIT